MNKKNKILSSISLLSIAAVCGIVFSNNSFKVMTIRGADDCAWNHYEAIESSYFDNGCKEYWVCCKHHEVEFTRPTLGTITEATHESGFEETLSSTDDRYDIKKTDHVVAIKVHDIPTSTGKFAFASREQFEGLRKFTFEGKWENATKLSWTAFGHYSDITQTDIYQHHYSFSIDNDGEWHSKTLTFNGENEYLYFCAPGGEFNEDATLLLRNITIECDEEVFKERALGIGDYFRSYFNDNFPDLKHSSLQFITRDGDDGSNSDRYLKLELNKLNAAAGKLNFITENQYQGVKYLKFKYKATGGIKSGCGGWMRFAITTTPGTTDIYSVFSKPAAGFSPTFDGEWHDATIQVESDGYVFFGAAVSEFVDGTTICFNDFEIDYYWNNASILESFNHDCMFFKHDKATRGSAWVTEPNV